MQIQSAAVFTEVISALQNNSRLKGRIYTTGKPLGIRNSRHLSLQTLTDPRHTMVGLIALKQLLCSTR